MRRATMTLAVLGAMALLLAGCDHLYGGIDGGRMMGSPVATDAGSR